MAKRFKKELSKENAKNKRKIKIKSDKDDENEELIQKKKIHPILKKVIKISILIMVIFLIVKLIIATHRWKMLAKDMLQNENSVVLDIDGNIIARIGDEKIKTSISSEQIPENLKNAYIAIEDERFYSHGGVDIKRTGGAIVTYITHFGSSPFGGSTITQQLVKNMTGDSSSKPTRKITEWWRAITLESCTTKEQILTAYLNTIYVGPNIYGVEAGAKYYFNKSAQELNLLESAFMAGINHSPNSYNPFSNANNNDKIKDRTRLVLDKMKELGKISNDDYLEAIKELEDGIKFERGTQEPKGNGIYSYHTDALLNQVIGDMVDKYNISRPFAQNYLELAGATIFSTQDTNIQKEIETEFQKKQYILESKQGGAHSQAAMVIIDHKTGYVKGCVGELGEKQSARPLNRATQSVRQTGSAMKPISVLAPALDKKIITNASIVYDVERDFEEGYHPEDYNDPLGEITLRRAVESSQNIPFVEIMEELKLKTSIKYMKKMGITTLTKKDKNLAALALGGLDKGISPLEMAGAYATIANDGVYIKPTFYTEVLRKSGKTIIKSKQKEEKVISKEAAFVLKKLLTQPVLGKEGTATYCKIDGMEVAAKTGTTDENYDRWLCGFTPYYTATCWYGYDQNETIDFNKQNPAGLIWASVMKQIHSKLPNAEFEISGNIETRAICSKTGKTANGNCKDTYTEYFIEGTAPDECIVH